jgi:hypothetical protein
MTFFATIETFNIFQMIAIAIASSAVTSLASSAPPSAIIYLTTAAVTTIVIMVFSFIILSFPSFDLPGIFPAIFAMICFLCSACH